VTITVVYDNNPYDPRLQTAWGFGCLVEIGEKTILFDTGGDGVTLLRNVVTLKIEPTSIDTIVLSHIHPDHTGGLTSLFAMGVRPTVYVPRSFPSDFKSRVWAYAELIEVQQVANIANGIYSTGEMGTGIVEQALVLNMTKGLTVVTGCAHPGISEIVCRSKEIGGDKIYLVLGGFHLDGANEERIKEIIIDFQRLGVRKVAPCHCTGNRAIALFREAYGEAFIQNGVGQVTEMINEE
jgi:7,8-dihydropterin-6-yl-methyl-4-(beta-D-ribofuranosyl)aminobenzene 5'-phosphate synthase